MWAPSVWEGAGRLVTQLGEKGTVGVGIRRACCLHSTAREDMNCNIRVLGGAGRAKGETRRVGGCGFVAFPPPFFFLEH